jgi:hypothetical protein
MKGETEQEGRGKRNKWKQGGKGTETEGGDRRPKI